MNKIEIHLRQVEEAMTLLDIGEVMGIVSVLRVVKRMGGTAYVIGNGGSHATAGHFANDLMKMCRIKAACVGDMAASMTAWGNDTGWENMFYGPLNEMVKDRDCLIGISCSGNSRNIVRAFIGAKDEWRILTAGLTGMGGEVDLLDLDGLVHVRVPDIRVQEDVHLMVCHAMVRELQAEGM